MSNPNDALEERLQDLLEQAREQEGGAAREELNALLRGNAAARRCLARLLVDEQALVSRLREDGLVSMVDQDSRGSISRFPAATSGRRASPWFSWRSLMATAAGLVLGLLSASMVSGSILPRSQVHPLALANPSFEETTGRLPSGFPRAMGIWSGDEAEVVTGGSSSTSPLQGGKALRFMRAEADRSAPRGAAYGCDVYQLVDLRAAREWTQGSPATLEFSAAFRDGRPPGSVLTKMSCRIYVFYGDPGRLGESWPNALEDALTTALGRWESTGDNPDWHRVAAQTVLPPRGEFAVVHLAVWDSSQEGRPAVFGQIYADDIRLSLHTQTPQSVPLSKR
jgi:hypothetical protein